jgi:hypothetical protein
VQVKHNPFELMDFSVQPIMFLLLFVYVFGGAISGSSHDYLCEQLGKRGRPARPGSLLPALGGRAMTLGCSPFEALAPQAHAVQGPEGVGVHEGARHPSLVRGQLGDLKGAGRVARVLRHSATTGNPAGGQEGRTATA